MKNYPIISTPLQIRILFSTKYRIITSKKLIYPLLFTYLLEITEVPVLHLIIAHEFSNFIIIYIHIYTDLHTVSIQINRVKEGCAPCLGGQPTLSAIVQYHSICVCFSCAQVTRIVTGTGTTGALRGGHELTVPRR